MYNKTIIKEIKELIKKEGLDCSVEEFKDRVDVSVYEAVNKRKTLKTKRKEVVAYAEKYNLKVDQNYLYAYRNHDKLGRGMIKLTIYKKGVYYKDWHCDMRKDIINSFGFGIFPKGNTPVRVKIEDWGVEVNREDGKGRVKGFEIV